MKRILGIIENTGARFNNRIVRFAAILVMLFSGWVWLSRYQPPGSNYVYSDPEVGISFEVPEGFAVHKDPGSDFSLLEKSDANSFTEYAISDEQDMLAVTLSISNQLKPLSPPITPSGLRNVNGCGMKGIAYNQHINIGKLAWPAIFHSAELIDFEKDLKVLLRTPTSKKQYYTLSLPTPREHAFSTALNSLKCVDHE